VDHVTSAYPPTLITAGNADPLRSHSESLVERLRAVGTDPETVFFARDHRPPLGHEYQFDLDGDAGRLFLDRTLGFLRRRLA
jgi:acetyl esterase/lipase